MKLPRRKFLQLAAGAAALPSVPRAAWAQAVASTREEFATRIKTEMDMWAKVIRAANIKAE